MDQETISRKEKIEMARKLTNHEIIPRYSRASSGEQIYEGNRKEIFGGYFFLRMLLSGFLLLAILGITRFDAMGEQQAQKYQAKLTKVLKNQTGVEHIKKILKSIG